jgi:hypothetical protein
MKTILIKSRNDADANLIVRYARKMKMKARFLSEKEADDVYLARLIDEGMAEEGEVPLESIRKKLRR